MKYIISILIAIVFITRLSAQDIYLKTDPEDAYVMKNDSLIGHTPLFISPLLGHIQLLKPEYTNATINLNNYDGNLVKLKFTGKKSNGSFYESNIFKIFIGGIVTLGAVTAYYKIKADNRFADYQTNPDPGLLKEVQKYDLISGISFAAVQINFGLIIYYLLAN
jgi:hypothetical protein